MLRLLGAAVSDLADLREAALFPAMDFFEGDRVFRGGGFRFALLLTLGRCGCLFVIAVPLLAADCPATSDFVGGFTDRDGSVLLEDRLAVVAGILALKILDLFSAPSFLACRVDGDCAGNNFVVTTFRF